MFGRKKKPWHSIECKSCGGKDFTYRLNLYTRKQKPPAGWSGMWSGKIDGKNMEFTVRKAFVCTSCSAANKLTCGEPLT